MRCKMISMNTLDDYEILQFGDFTTGDDGEAMVTDFEILQFGDFTTGDDGEAMVTDFENYLIRIGEFHNG